MSGAAVSLGSTSWYPSWRYPGPGPLSLDLLVPRGMFSSLGMQAGLPECTCPDGEVAAAKGPDVRAMEPGCGEPGFDSMQWPPSLLACSLCHHHIGYRKQMAGWARSALHQEGYLDMGFCWVPASESSQSVCSTAPQHTWETDTQNGTGCPEPGAGTSPP